jgi:membrane protein implicated in regulation of membrane protease activity
MEWWHWLVVGIILIALEMAAAGGFYVIFFGIAALVVGGLRLIDIAGPLWIQLLLFSALSVASLMFFRHRMLRWMNLHGEAADVDSLVGELAVPLDDIPAGGVGRVEMRGSVWTARNSTGSGIPARQRCSVVRTEKLTVFIKPEEAAR